MKKFSTISATALILIVMAGSVTNGAGEKPICIDLNDQRYPAISGNRIVWMDVRNSNWDIYIYDLSTGEKSKITSGLNSQRYPAIWGDRTVWEDYRNGNADIYMYDLSTGYERAICTDPNYQEDPAISGDRIVWMDVRNGNWDIYMYDLATGIETPVCTDPYSQVIQGYQVIGSYGQMIATRPGMYTCMTYPRVLKHR